MTVKCVRDAQMGYYFIRNKSFTLQANYASVMSG